MKILMRTLPILTLALLLSACSSSFGQLKPTPMMKSIVNTNGNLPGLQAALGISGSGSLGITKTNGSGYVTPGNDFQIFRSDVAGQPLLDIQPGGLFMMNGTFSFSAGVFQVGLTTLGSSGGNIAGHFVIDASGNVTADGNANIALTATADRIVASTTLRSDGSNYFAKAIMFSTNQNQMKPDFSVAEQLMSTNAAFTFLAPVGVDSTKTGAQWHLVNVTNTTAVAVLMTSPANCHTVGTPYVTNLTYVWVHCYAQKFTNFIYEPVF